LSNYVVNRRLEPSKLSTRTLRYSRHVCDMGIFI